MISSHEEWLAKNQQFHTDILETDRAYLQTIQQRLSEAGVACRYDKDGDVMGGNQPTISVYQDLDPRFFYISYNYEGDMPEQHICNIVAEPFNDFPVIPDGNVAEAVRIVLDYIAER